MTFEQFRQNVEQWSAARGIYEHSTAAAQLMKALSELGELADGIIKNDYREIKDAIGDVAVCVVNYAKLTNQRIEQPAYEDGALESPTQAIGETAIVMGKALSAPGEANAFDSQFILAMMVAACQMLDTPENPLTFSDCCIKAWGEIKDRTGRMVAGGAFVKDE